MSLLLRFSSVLFVSGLCRVVEPLFCNHTVLPPATSTNHEEVELLIDCSSNYLSVTTVFNIPWVEYTILYTCIHEDHPEPIQHIAIANALVNKTKSLDQKIPCGSLCTFGGCYSSGPLGNVVDLTISPLRSCFVCSGGESGVCTTELNHDVACSGPGSGCIPSLNLGSGTVHCNCSFQEDCPSTSSTTGAGPMTVPITGAVHGLECSCICTVLSEGYSCECSSTHLSSSPFPCSNISGCDFCDAVVSDCKNTGDSKYCFCSERNGYNCTSVKGNAPSINLMITPILVASLLLISCTMLCFLLIILCSVLSKNRRKRETRPVFMDSEVFDEISTFDPVDVAVPRYQALSGSFSTLLHSFDKLSSVKQLRTASSLSNHTDSCMDSECHLSDAEGYIMCRDCPGSSCSEIKTCHHCQMNTDGHDTTTMQHELHRQSSCSSYHL